MRCLVLGCRKWLRIVHTVEFSQGGAQLQIITVAVYEEQWVSPFHDSISTLLSKPLPSVVHFLVIYFCTIIYNPCSNCVSSSPLCS
jgi:hypothetical protein